VQPLASDLLRSSPQPPATSERGVDEACPQKEEERSFDNPAPKRRPGALKGEDRGETASDQEEDPEKAGKKLKYRPCFWLVLLRLSAHTRFFQPNIAAQARRGKGVRYEARARPRR
jgi:hypothetical protein